MTANQLSRRSLLQLLGAAAGTAAVAPLLGGRAEAAPGPRSAIVLWMNGGPSHIDTWDPKPGSRTGGPFRAIRTRVPGLSVSEHLPRLAERADRLAVVRGMTSAEGNHARAQELVHTGHAPGGTVAHPALGAWASAELGGGGDLPAYVTVGGAGAGPGFLGVAHGPLIVPEAGQPPANLVVAPSASGARMDRRLAMLDAIEAEHAGRTGDARVAGRRAVHDKAVRLMRSPRVAAFDVEPEPTAVRKAYGDTPFGRGCLVARRLVESGVRLVEVVLDGWDTHKDGFTRSAELMGALDPAMSALLDDLAARAMLERTLVVCIGEFGRTPRINGDEGRDHHPGAWSAVLAGGGVRGGVVHGATDDEGRRVVEDAVTVPDLFATITALMGIDPTKTVVSPRGRPVAIVEGGTPVAALMA